MSDLESASDVTKLFEASAKKHQAFLQTPEGIEWNADNEKKLAERDRRDAQREIDARNEKSARTGVPRRIRELIQSGLHQSRALERVVEWNTGRPDTAWCLVLSAGKGSGKSVAAGWWIGETREGAHRNWKGDDIRRWWTGTELAVLDWYGGDYEDVANMSGPLVIDDLGTEFTDAKGFFLQRLDSLVDARYREYRPTIITTNLSGKDFAARYGQRVVDRIREGGTFYEFNQQSMRGSP